jgi:pilus assembly protein CpaE
MTAPEKIRVLIVDDNQETRDNIRRMLAFEPSVEVVDMAGDGKEAVEKAVRLIPDVIIMDINMPDMDGIEATEAIHKKIPQSQIVILSVESEPGYMRRAMLAGARDFLPKPPSITELVDAVRRAGEIAHEEKAHVVNPLPGTKTDNVPGSNGSLPTVRGKTIVIYSPKGGAGCSVIAVNLAIALQTIYNNVALVDASLQFGDIAVLLNEQVKNNLLDLTSHADELDPELVRDVMTKHTTTGLHILACPPKPELAEHVSPDAFGKTVEHLSSMYDFVVVDTTSHLTESVQTALELADIILLVTTQELPSIKSCNLFLNLAKASGLTNRILFVMNRYDKRKTITPERISESLKHPVVATILQDDIVITQSINRGVPFILEYKNQPIGKSFQNLVDVILQRTEPRVTSEKETPNKV